MTHTGDFVFQNPHAELEGGLEPCFQFSENRPRTIMMTDPARQKIIAITSSEMETGPTLMFVRTATFLRSEIPSADLVNWSKITVLLNGQSVYSDPAISPVRNAMVPL